MAFNLVYLVVVFCLIAPNSKAVVDEWIMVICITVCNSSHKIYVRQALTFPA